MDAKLPNILELCFNALQKIRLFSECNPNSQKHRIKGTAILTFTVTLVTTGHLLKAISSDNLTEITSNLAILSMILFLAIKSWNIAFHCSKLMELSIQIEKQIETLKEDQQFDNLKSVKQRLNLTMRIVMLFIRTIAIALAFLITMTFVMRKYSFHAFETFTEGRSFGIYAISVFLNIIINCYFTVCYVIANSLPIVYISYAVGFNDELTARLKRIGISKELDYDEIIECIKIHQMIKHFVHDFIDCFKLVFSLQNIFSQISICMFAFNLVYAKSFNDLILFFICAAISLLEIGLPCYFGSELEKSSESLLDAIYQSSWLNCELKTKKVLVILMENLKQPMRINCYSVFDVNLKLFTVTMNKAYSFYCVLSKLID